MYNNVLVDGERKAFSTIAWKQTEVCMQAQSFKVLIETSSGIGNIINLMCI